MNKIVTDNSKVNVNLLEEIKLLKKQVEGLKAKKHETTKQLNLFAIVSNFLGKQAKERDLPIDELFIRYDSELNEIDLLHKRDCNRYKLLESYK